MTSTNAGWPAHRAGTTPSVVRRDRYGEPLEEEAPDLELRAQGTVAYWRAHLRDALPERDAEPGTNVRRRGLKGAIRERELEARRARRR